MNITVKYTPEQVAAMVAYCHDVPASAVTFEDAGVSVETKLAGATRADRFIKKATEATS